MEHVDLYQDAAEEWRWRRVAANGNIVSDSSEGYVRRIDAYDMARTLNPNVPVLPDDEDDMQILEMKC